MTDRQTRKVKIRVAKAERSRTNKVNGVHVVRHIFIKIIYYQRTAHQAKDMAKTVLGDFLPLAAMGGWSFHKPMPRKEKHESYT